MAAGGPDRGIGAVTSGAEVTCRGCGAAFTPEPDGQGVMTFPDGRRFEGEFRDGDPGSGSWAVESDRSKCQ